MGCPTGLIVQHVSQSSVVALCIHQHFDATPLINPMNTRRNAQSGFTIIELMIVMVILGILAAFAFPAYASLIRRARYAEAKQQMGSIAKSVEIARVENGTYPKDVGPGQRPPEITYWPDQVDIPFSGLYDYDHWGVGDDQCYVQIGYSGDVSGRMYPSFEAIKETPGFKEVADDVVLSIALYECSASRGAVR